MYEAMPLCLAQLLVSFGPNLNIPSTRPFCFARCTLIGSKNLPEAIIVNDVWNFCRMHDLHEYPSQRSYCIGFTFSASLFNLTINSHASVEFTNCDLLIGSTLYTQSNSAPCVVLSYLVFFFGSSQRALFVLVWLVTTSVGNPYFPHDTTDVIWMFLVLFQPSCYFASSSYWFAVKSCIDENWFAR